MSKTFAYRSANKNVFLHFKYLQVKYYRADHYVIMTDMVWVES